MCKQTNEFVYLGGDVNHNTDLSIEDDRRIRNAWCSFRKYSLELTVEPTERSPRAQNLDAKSRGTREKAVRLRHVEPVHVPIRHAALSQPQLPDSLHRFKGKSERMLRMASVARVNRRLRRYYLIVRLLPNVFALAYRSLGSIYYDTGSPQDGKTPFGWLHPCRLVTDSRRYLIVGAPAYSSFIFSLNNRASTIS